MHECPSTEDSPSSSSSTRHHLLTSSATISYHFEMSQVPDAGRSANFTEDDLSLLTDLVQEHQAIVNDKGRDTVTTTKKAAAWDSITAKFNSVTTNAPRSVSQLRKCWENAVRRAKEDRGNVKRMRIQTGSGVAPVPLSDVSNKVIASTGTALRPLQNVFDSDRDQHHGDEVSIIPSTSANGGTESGTVEKEGVPFFLPKRGTKRKPDV